MRCGALLVQVEFIIPYSSGFTLRHVREYKTFSKLNVQEEEAEAATAKADTRNVGYKSFRFVCDACTKRICILCLYILSVCSTATDTRDSKKKKCSRTVCNVH